MANEKANEKDYVDLGLSCADVCKALDRGLNGRRPDELNRSVLEAIEQLTRWVGLAVWTESSTYQHSQSQNCGRDSGEGRRAGQTESGLSTLPRQR
jgi:hypothetical protein